MEKFSKGFIIFAAFTAGLAAIVLILSLLVWKDPETLQPATVMPITQQEAKKLPASPAPSPVPATEKEEAVETTTPPETVTSAEESASEMATPSETENFTEEEEITEEDEEEEDRAPLPSGPLVPDLMTGKPEDELTKVFTGLTKLVTPARPLEIISPLPALQKKRGSYYLPQKASDGTEPWQTYKRPFPEQTGNKVAFIVYGLGLKNEETTLAIAKLPPEVTLSFSPYADNLSAQIAKARQAGHETMIDLSLQDKNYPAIDGGPNTITTSSSSDENIAKLEKTLQNAGALIGVTGLNGDALFSRPEVLNPVYEAIFAKGLLFLGTDTSTAFPDIYDGSGAFLKADILFTDDMFYPAIENNFTSLENIAKTRGQALMAVPPTKILLDAIVKWNDANQQKGADKLIIAPASALVKK